MLQSNHDLSAKYFPRKNTEKPEYVDQKFELVSLTHISNAYILWETPETIFGRNSNNIYDVFLFGKNGFADFDLKYFPFCQGNFLQNTWLLSTVFGFVQQKQAKSWLKSLFVNCDSDLNIQYDKNLPVLKFQLGNPLKPDDWQNVELEDLRLANKKDTGVWDCFVGCDWNKDALEFQDGDVAEPFQAKPYVGPFWMLYFEKAMANVVGSYGDLHGASLDRFDIFGALMKSPLVQTFEFQADDSKAAVDLFDSFSTYDGSEIAMVARIRKETIVKEVVAKDGRLEILGQYEQYCAITGWYKYKKVQGSTLDDDQLPKWVLKVRDFYCNFASFPINILTDKAGRDGFFNMDFGFKEKIGFNPRRSEKGISFMFEKELCDWVEKVWVCSGF